MIKHFSSVQHRKTGVDIDCEQKFDQMPVWWMQRRGGHHCSQTHARLLQTAVSTRFHSCLNTHSQLFKWVLAPLKAQTLNQTSTQKAVKRVDRELGRTWATPGVMSIISDTSNEVIKEPLFWASLLEAAGTRLGCCCERDSPDKDKAALYQSNTPIALIPQRPPSQDAAHGCWSRYFWFRSHHDCRHVGCVHSTDGWQRLC